MLRLCQFCAIDFERRINAGTQFVNPRSLDIETNGLVLAAELNDEWQADIAKTDDADFQFVDIHVASCPSILAVRSGLRCRTACCRGCRADQVICAAALRAPPVTRRAAPKRRHRVSRDTTARGYP
jgi:hypothetical protein